MKPGLFLAGLFLWTLPYSSDAQEYSYTHYDIGNGLAGSTVYAITQDKDGFIWASTETGVSRFDGTHFRNFTTNDGLPDVEILQMFADSKDRVWMAPFSKSICYYIKGKIHNQVNDSLLGGIRIRGLIEHFAEDGMGNILVQEPTCLHLISAPGVVKEIDSVNGRPIMYCHDAIESSDGEFLVQIRDTVYHFDGSVFKPVLAVTLEDALRIPGYIGLARDFVVYRRGSDTTCIQSIKNGKAKYLRFESNKYRHVSFEILDDSLVFVNESVGTTAYDVRTLDRKHFLPGLEISCVFRDDEGNLWYATIGQGIYRLNSEEIVNFRLNGSRCRDCGANAIAKVHDQLLVGSARNSVFRYRLPRLGLLDSRHLNNEEKKRVVSIIHTKGGHLLFGTDFSLSVHSEDELRMYQYIQMSVKGVYSRPDGKILVASGFGAFLLDVDGGIKVDTVWPERTTAIFYCRDTTYIGTLNGLFRIPPGGRPYFMGQDIPGLKSRIAAITGDKYGTIWVAPYDEKGVLGVRNGKLVRRIGSAEGLTSNICRVLYLQGDFLWIGTDKGLNRVDVADPGRPIVKYTAGDGLGSNVINSVFVDSQRVYVATTAGFSYFDQTRVSDSSACRFVWLSISTDGRSRMQDTADLQLSFRTSDIRFEFAGISYRSSGDISYRYRLIGLDTVWRKTQQSFLNYPVLPGGDYVLQVAAVDKFGNKSPMADMHFIVSTPIWHQVWFLIASGLALVALGWLLMLRRIKRIRQRQEEERALTRRINEMEHMALQAQMNPHFIFNCMNSIQQYIFDQDVFGANKYISGFSKLIRATLHNSNRPMITLAEEIDYLSNYLSLEQLRFKEKMEYRLEIDPGIIASQVLVPPMIIQPYAENSIRHGLRHKTTGKGLVVIWMEEVEDCLIVTIEDNGIGRKKAAMYKTPEHIEYQSRGMSLTAERIKAMNSVYGRLIEVHVTDLEDEEGEAAGTRVRIRFPLRTKTMKTYTNDQNRFDR